MFDTASREMRDGDGAGSTNGRTDFDIGFEAFDDQATNRRQQTRNNREESQRSLPHRRPQNTRSPSPLDSESRSQSDNSMNSDNSLSASEEPQGDRQRPLGLIDADEILLDQALPQPPIGVMSGSRLHDHLQDVVNFTSDLARHPAPPIFFRMRRYEPPRARREQSAPGPARIRVLRAPVMRKTRSAPPRFPPPQELHVTHNEGQQPWRGERFEDNQLLDVGQRAYEIEEQTASTSSWSKGVVQPHSHSRSGRPDSPTLGVMHGKRDGIVER